MGLLLTSWSRPTLGPPLGPARGLPSPSRAWLSGQMLAGMGVGRATPAVEPLSPP